MRTTLDIDDDVLLAAKEIARNRKISVGKVLSEMARRGFTDPNELEERNGFLLFPSRPGGQPVTLELVNRLRDEVP